MLVSCLFIVCDGVIVDLVLFRRSSYGLYFNDGTNFVFVFLDSHSLYVVLR